MGPRQVQLAVQRGARAGLVAGFALAPFVSVLTKDPGAKEPLFDWGAPLYGEDNTSGGASLAYTLSLALLALFALSGALGAVYGLLVDGLSQLVAFRARAALSGVVASRSGCSRHTCSRDC